MNNDQPQWLFSITGDHPSSMNGMWTAHGVEPKDVFACPIGPVGSTVTFFDDQAFRPNENALMVHLSRESTGQSPVRVQLGQDRITDHKPRQNGVYSGTVGTEYSWMLFKYAKPNWVAEIFKGISVLSGGMTWDEMKKEVAKAVGTQWGPVAGLAASEGLDFIPNPDTGMSDNYRVDNVSSVKFG